MYSKLIIYLALFSAFIFAQTNDFKNDTAKENKVLYTVIEVVTILEAVTILEPNATFRADLAALRTAFPSSVVQEAEEDPEALISQIGANDKIPAWVLPAIPRAVIEYLELLVAKTIKAAVSNVEGYLAQIAEESRFISAISVLMTAVPKSLQQAFRFSPAGLLENVVMAKQAPLWVTTIPSHPPPLLSVIGSVAEEFMSIIHSDLQSDISIVRASIGRMTSSGYAIAPGTGGVVGTVSATPIAYMEAAVPMTTAAAGTTASAGRVTLMPGVWMTLHVSNVFASWTWQGVSYLTITVSTV